MQRHVTEIERAVLSRTRTPPTLSPQPPRTDDRAEMSMAAIRERLAEVERAIQDRSRGTQEPSQLEQDGRIVDPLRRRLYDDDWTWIGERQPVSSGLGERTSMERPAVRIATGISTAAPGSAEPTVAVAMKRKTLNRHTGTCVSEESEHSDDQTDISRHRKSHKLCV
jgi:hypothetical protein